MVEAQRHLTNEDPLTLTRTDEKSEKLHKENHNANLCNQRTVDLRISEKADFVQECNSKHCIRESIEII